MRARLGEMKKDAANTSAFSGSADVEGIKDTANLLLHFISLRNSGSKSFCYVDSVSEPSWVRGIDSDIFFNFRVNV